MTITCPWEEDASKISTHVILTKTSILPEVCSWCRKILVYSEWSSHLQEDCNHMDYWKGFHWSPIHQYQHKNVPKLHSIHLCQCIESFEGQHIQNEEILIQWNVSSPPKYLRFIKWRYTPASTITPSYDTQGSGSPFFVVFNAESEQNQRYTHTCQ